MDSNGSVSNQAFASIKSAIEKTDKQSEVKIISSKVFLCTNDNPTLIKDIEAKIYPWLDNYREGDKKISLACLSDGHKQAIKNEIRSSLGLACRIAKGLIIPLDHTGQLLDKETFTRLVYD